MAVIQNLQLRLFLEGIEVPVSGVSLVISKNQPARADITVIYTPELLKLKPRTLVHLFFYNELSNGNTVDTEADDYDSSFSLLFMGETVGIRTSKSEANQSAQLICEDFTSYHSTAFSYFMASRDLESDDITTFLRDRAVFSAATTTYGLTGSSDFLGILQNVFKSGAKPHTPGFQNAKGMLGGLLRTIEIFTGVSDRDGGANQFFNLAELRLNLLAQIGVYDSDTTSEKLLSSTFILNFIKTKVDSLGQLITLRDILRYLLQYMYYAMVPNPSARYIPVTQATVSTELPNTIKLKLSEIVALPNETELYATELESDPIPVVRELLTAVEQLRTTDISLATKLSARITRALSPSNKLQPSVKTTLSGIRDETYASELNTVPKVPTTIIIPDLFFAVAPTCNVVYPDMYFSLSYQSSAAFETTRHHLSTNLDTQLTGGFAGKKVFYAPSLNELEETQSQLFSNPEQQRSVLLFDHEKYTGIIPSFSRTDRLVYEIAMGMNRPAIEATQTVDSQERTKDFFIRVANYRFIKEKLSNRRLSVSGIFNPFAVVGFPMIILDRPDLPGPENYTGLVDSITHTITQEGGATTSYSLSNARPLENEQDEFLNNLLLPAEVYMLTPDKFDPPITLQLSETSSAEDKFVFCNAAELGSTYVTRAVAGFELQIPTRPGFFREGSTYDGKQLYMLSVDEYVVEEQVAATELVSLLARPKDLSLEQLNTTDLALSDLPTGFPTKITLYFRKAAASTEVPIEEALRPRFIDEAYSSAKIHQIYQQLLGCSSTVQRVSSDAALTRASISLDSETVDVVPQREAIRSLSAAYSAAKYRAKYALEFVDRPMATLPDILSDAGFHRRAFGDQDFVSQNPLANIDRVVSSPSQEDCGEGTIAIDPTQLARLYPQVDQRLDVRVDKNNAVRDYVHSTTNRVSVG